MITEQPAAAGTFGLSHDAWGRLVMIDGDGRRHVGVEPVRAFPISDSLHWISICDIEGRELACVHDLAELPASVRQVLEEDLARREFVPVLQRIYNVSTETAPSEWDVQTDRGRTRFMLHSEDDIRRLVLAVRTDHRRQRHPLLDQRPGRLRRRQRQDPRTVLVGACHPAQRVALFRRCPRRQWRQRFDRRARGRHKVVAASNVQHLAPLAASNDPC